MTDYATKIKKNIPKNIPGMAFRELLPPCGATSTMGLAISEMDRLTANSLHALHAAELQRAANQLAF
jgi:hypothetical protein